MFNMLNRCSDLRKIGTQCAHFCPFALSDDLLPAPAFLTISYLREGARVMGGAKGTIGLGIAYYFGQPLPVRTHSGLV